MKLFILNVICLTNQSLVVRVACGCLGHMVSIPTACSCHMQIHDS